MDIVQISFFCRGGEGHLNSVTLQRRSPAAASALLPCSWSLIPWVGGSHHGSCVLVPGGKGRRRSEVWAWVRETQGVCRALCSSCSQCAWGAWIVMDSFSDVVKIHCNFIFKKTKNPNSQQESFIFSRDTIMHFQAAIKIKVQKTQNSHEREISSDYSL